MSKDTGSGHIRKNRPPRVQIQYADPYDSEKLVELPFVMGVMADLSGNKPGIEKPDVEERKFTKIDESVDDYMASVEPGISLAVDNKLDPESTDKLGIELKFKKMKDLEPASIAKQVPALNKLLETRQHLAELKQYMNSNPRAQQHVKRLLNDPELLRALGEQVNKPDDDA